MKHSLAVLILLAGMLNASGQSILGKWITIDDESGEERSVVEVYERKGKIFGKVTKIFSGQDEDPDPVCKECPEDDLRYNKKVIGMDIIRDMNRQAGYYTDGDILDPKIGKIYRCKLWLEDNKLKVRGYWGLFYRTQTWIKQTKPE